MNFVPSLAGERILVAGGAGFIGRHLCARLLDLGAQVIALDNFQTAARRDTTALEKRSGFSLIEGDVLEPVSISADGIFNLASPASPRHYQRDPVLTLRINIIGTLNLLERARALKARYVQASTSEVYGDPHQHPQREDYFGNVNPVGPRACYDEGKRAAETLCSDFARQYGVDVRIARIFNTYGPGMAPDDGRIISNFVTQALAGEPLTIYGDGEQTRSLCYVEDTVEGLIALYAKPGAGPSPINIGNPAEITVAAIANAIIDKTASRSRRVYLPLPEDDPRQRCPDISKAKKLLGWEPQIALAEGLDRTIAHFRGLESHGMGRPAC